jgi:hypothetical protein
MLTHWKVSDHDFEEHQVALSLIASRLSYPGSLFLHRSRVLCRAGDAEFLHFRQQSGALEAQAGRRDLGSADHRAEIAESGLAIIHSSPILLKSVAIARKLADELSISFGMTGVGSSPLRFRCSFWNSGS